MEKTKINQTFKNSENKAKAGFVSIVGRPSAGKSTFLNTACGEKVSIVSPVPQTTRNTIRGIVNTNLGQVVFLDSPGLHDSEKKLNLLLKSLVQDIIPDSDCVLYLIDASREPGDEEKQIVEILKKHTEKLVIGINKIDLPSANPKNIIEFISSNLPNLEKSRIIEISAEKDQNIEKLLKEIYNIVPTGEAFYPEEFYTDQEVDFRIAEIIREKAILNTREEIPHSIYIEIADIEQRKNGKHLWVRAFLVVERESQKSMVIGKGASMIKKIRTEALKDLQKIFPYRVFLDLQVKVNKNWRQKDFIIGSLVKR